MEAISVSGVYSFIKLLLALLLVVLNGLFVAAEFSFVKVRPTRMAQLAADGNNRARLVQECLDNLDAYLSVSQLGITLASLGLGWLGEPAVATLLIPLFKSWGINSPALLHSLSFLIAFAFITFLHVVLGELVPKSLAIQKAESLALGLAKPMRAFYYLFYPGVIALNGTASKFISLFGIEPAREADVTHSEEELRMLILESYEGGQINKSEQELLQNVFSFEKRVAEEIMVPRPEVIFLDRRENLDSILAKVEQTMHTRYPLCDGSLDRVVGLIHIKDLLYLQGSDKSLDDIKREVAFVPEGMPLDRLLQQFQCEHQHLAMVIDEYGGTLGIVTMDNILEELVGEIQDEFDQEEPELIVQDDGSALVSGRMFIDDAARHFGLRLDDEDEQYSTLAGYILGKLGKRPVEGDSITVDNLTFVVMRMKGMRIDRLKVQPKSNRNSTQINTERT
ncbi:MAG: hemolysin family protein [Syntrophomonadaceae bacterium]